MTHTMKRFLTAAFILGTSSLLPSTALAQPGPPPPPARQKITCSSNDNGRNWCEIGANRDVQLVHQISGAACVRGRTWDVDQRGIWVDRGCRADFSIGPVVGTPRTPPPQFVTCSSTNGGRNWCDIGNRRDVQLNRQISRGNAPCNRGTTWGVDQRGLWVDRGCSAQFRIQ
jgi:Protein of unknown function (DUF3011)